MRFSPARARVTVADGLATSLATRPCETALGSSRGRLSSRIVVRFFSVGREGLEPPTR